MNYINFPFYFRSGLFNKKGRMSKSQYLSFFYTSFVFCLPFGLLLAIFPRGSIAWFIYGLVIVLYYFLTNILARVKRLHDLNLSGKNLFKTIPFFGVYEKDIIYKEGTFGPNSFGPSSK